MNYLKVKSDFLKLIRGNRLYDKCHRMLGPSLLVIVFQTQI